MNTNQILIVARKHVGNGAAMESSARLCLADAVKFHAIGDYMAAERRALRSLSYSIGILHADYRKVQRLVIA